MHEGPHADGSPEMRPARSPGERGRISNCQGSVSGDAFRGYARHLRCSFIFGYQCAVCAIAAVVKAAMIEAATGNCGIKRNCSAG